MKPIKDIKKFLLNLDRRHDRLMETYKRLMARGIAQSHVERIPAVDKTIEISAKQAHNFSFQKILRLAKERKYPEIIIFEDDIELRPMFSERWSALTVPDGWDMLYLGCLHKDRPFVIAGFEGLVKATRAYDTHALVIRNTVYDALLNILEQGGAETDVLFATLHDRIKAYACYPNLAWQTVHYSDICSKTYSNYTWDGQQILWTENILGLSSNLTRLKKLSDFRPVFGKWRGASVYHYSDPLGNTGDKLIREGEKQLFAYYGIHVVEPGKELHVDSVFYGGGGNMGGPYGEANRAIGMAIDISRKRKVPLVILPQTWWKRTELPRNTIQWAREPESIKRFAPDAQLAPDLGLAYEPLLPKDSADFCLYNKADFFRMDQESLAGHRSGQRDPASLCETPEDYVKLALDCREIRTDRLHFAIAGLIAGRKVTLFSNSTHKNRSMWQKWLEPMGCGFDPNVL